MILITRPIESAKKLQLIFNEDSIDTFIEPLTSIHISNRNINLQNCIYLITSQHAVDFLENSIMKDFISKSEFIVIGHATSKKLLRVGAKKIIQISKDSNELLNYFKRSRIRKKIIYLCGSNRNQSFILNIKKLNTDFSVRQVYKVVPSVKLSQKLIEQLRKRKIKIVLIFSLLNAKLFLSLCQMNSSIR